jgi:hypothetical protein
MQPLKLSNNPAPLRCSVSSTLLDDRKRIMRFGEKPTPGNDEIIASFWASVNFTFFR